MNDFREKDYKIFELFEKNWALVTAGTPECFNGCTIGWGCMGTVWNRPAVTVFLHPARYTLDFLRRQDTFTLSFFPKEYRPALAVMGSRSGRDGDKARAAGLTPMSVGDSVSYREASLTLLCRKLYAHSFAREELAAEIAEYYRAHPAVYPPGQGRRVAAPLGLRRRDPRSRRKGIKERPRGPQAARFFHRKKHCPEDGAAGSLGEKAGGRERKTRASTGSTNRKSLTRLWMTLYNRSRKRGAAAPAGNVTGRRKRNDDGALRRIDRSL